MTATSRPHPRVLVAEDDDDLRDVLVMLLADEGYLVGEAHNGREALERLRDFDHWLVLLDLMMPVMDGYAVLRAIQADPNLAARCTVVVLSASLRNALRPPPAQLAPAVAALPKPYDLDALLTLLERLSAVDGNVQGKDSGNT
jgi:CheY-like chemotaxis protein